MSGYIFKKHIVVFFTFTNSVRDPEEMQHCAAFHYWVFAVCKRTRLGVSRIKMVNIRIKHQPESKANGKKKQ